MSDVEIIISPDDVEALARLAEAEAESIVEYYKDQGYSEEEAMYMAYAPIVDSIINRVASDSWYGDSIQDVINKDYQYTPVTSAGGDWENLPPAESETVTYISEYLSDRAQGSPSSIGTATHYYNPTRSDPSWGPEMDNQSISGDPNYTQYTPQSGDETETHVFGNPEGDAQPNPYHITKGEDSAFFDPSPVPIPAHKPPTPPEYLQPGAGDDSDVPLPWQKAAGEWLQNILNEILTGYLPASPLVLDLDGDGIELTSVNGTGSVYWDIDQDGMAEATGWITGGDGLLALDRNGDGLITEHSELFGNESTDGFLMLAEFDSNSDGIINASDTVFENLLVWVDSNSDGYSQASELYSLNSLGITEIDLGFAAVDYEIAGNAISSESSFTMNGTTHTIVDAWFTYDKINHNPFISLTNSSCSFRLTETPAANDNMGINSHTRAA